MDNTEYFENTSSFDFLGGSFKDYVIHNNAPASIDALKQNMDSLSCDYVDYFVKASLDFPDIKLRSLFGPNKSISKYYYPQWLKEDVTKTISLDPPVGGHGLALLSDRAREYVLGKSFFDLGAYDGGSVLVLEKYQPYIVYSFEISPKNEQLYQAKSSEFRCRYRFFRMAAGKSKGSFTFNDIGTSGTTLFRDYDAPNKTSVDVVTLDDFVAEFHTSETQPGFIKMDIEGSAYDATLGAFDTICKHRPVMSIAIYHSPQEFFKVKPLIESWKLGYRFSIRMFALKYTTKPYMDTHLICCPEELI